MGFKITQPQRSLNQKKKRKKKKEKKKEVQYQTNCAYISGKQN